MIVVLVVVVSLALSVSTRAVLKLNVMVETTTIVSLLFSEVKTEILSALQ
jgi:hypothetical protein